MTIRASLSAHPTQLSTKKTTARCTINTRSLSLNIYIFCIMYILSTFYFSCSIVAIAKELAERVGALDETTNQECFSAKRYDRHPSRLFGREDSPKYVSSRKTSHKTRTVSRRPNTSNLFQSPRHQHREKRQVTTANSKHHDILRITHNSGCLFFHDTTSRHTTAFTHTENYEQIIWVGVRMGVSSTLPGSPRSLAKVLVSVGRSCRTVMRNSPAFLSCGDNNNNNNNERRIHGWGEEGGREAALCSAGVASGVGVGGVERKHLSPLYSPSVGISC